MTKITVAIAAIMLVVSALATARADPKVITVEGCAKVETAIVHDVRGNGDRYSQTVRCIGDEAGQPKVKADETTGIMTMPYCLNCLSITPGSSHN